MIRPRSERDGAGCERCSLVVNAQSPFRRFDARVKLAVSLAASAAVMLPLAPLTLFAVGFAGLLGSAGATSHAAGQVWRLRWLFLVLLVVDWAFVGPAFAVLIALRLGVMICAFSFLVTTTTADELRTGLEGLGLPPRGAFVLGEAFAALDLFERELRGIVEAQRARGIVLETARGPRRERLRQLAALVVPAVVLATQRAWAVHEAAATRGFGAPHRRVWTARALGRRDWALLSGALSAVVALWWWQ